MKAINPATGELIGEYEEHGEVEVREKLDVAVSAFVRWRETSFPPIRRQRMRMLAGVWRSTDRTRAGGRVEEGWPRKGSRGARKQRGLPGQC